MTSDRSLGNVGQRALGEVQVLVLVLVLVVGPGWLGVPWTALRPSGGFLAPWWCHLGVTSTHRNPWVGRGYVVLRGREFGC